MRILVRGLLQLFVFLAGMACGGLACADTVPDLFASFAGNVNFVGTAQTLRTQADGGNSCAVTTGDTMASLAGVPSGATITAAYLYWAGSSTDVTSAPDYTVTFDGSAVSAASDRRYTATYNNVGTDLHYFSGAADVTTLVAAKGNGTYSFSGLSVNTGSPHCDVSGVVAGWSLLVIYSHVSEDLRVINVFEGFQAFRGSSITLTPNNFVIPSSPINGKHAYITWEGDVGNSGSLNGFSEGLTFNGTVLQDGSNPSNNQFNSVSTITSPTSGATYGVDFDSFDIDAYLTAGETSATSVYSSGGDLVLLSAEVISVTNTPVADLAIATTRNSALNPGQNATYTFTVTNDGPNAETGPISVTSTLPTGLSYSSFSGTGWSCNAAGQTVTCTRTGSLANGASSAVTITVAVVASATGAKSVTATVAGTSFDNVSGNNSSTDDYTISADLVLAMTRNTTLSPGSNATYTITVTNDGPSRDPGTISVSNTLPTGLSFVSGIGTNWSCGAAGQAVTCTYSGGLSAAVSASYTLTVAVSSSAAGAITNSATVSSTSGLDGNSANNTASDSFTFSPYAYYKMDETSWSGASTVLDSSGSNRHGSRLSTSTVPTGYPPASPASSAIAGTPGTCGVGTIPAGAAAGAHGVSLPIDVNSIGNSGTIAFWYRSNSAWNDGNHRMLFDASANLGNGNADRHFFLAKRSDGRLTFSLEDSGGGSGTVSTATSTTAFSYAANTWHHIAVTWNLAADRLFIYVDAIDGTTSVNPVATSTTNVNGTLGAVTTLYLGAQRDGSIAGTPTGYTANTANGYIDEVYIYNTALSGSAIAGIRALTHACTASVHHYELSLPSSSITCLPTTVTVNACADSSSPCTNKFAGVSGQTATLNATGGGTLASNTVTFDATGTASTTLSFPTATDGTSVSVALSGEQSTATSSRQCCPDGVSCSVANSCSTIFKTAGFIFSGSANGSSLSSIPAQVAGTTSGQYYLRAVQSDASTKACEAALSGTASVNFGYVCNDPATCYTSNLMTLNATNSTLIARNDSNNVTNYLPVTMTFDADGNAPFTFNYLDVGSVTLRANKTVNGALLSGASPAFVVKPAGFTVTNIKRTSDNFDNPATSTTDATGTRFVKAGESFSATVTALTSTGTNAHNYGKETSAESVKLTATPVAGLGMSSPSSTVGGNFDPFGDGVATGTDFSWKDVGVITLTPSVKDGNYLGAGDVTGTTTGRVGRFYAAKFALSDQALLNRTDICPAGTNCSAFTYMGESMSVTFTLTAVASDGTTPLQNYTWSSNAAHQFAKLDPTTAVTVGTGGPLELGAVNSAATRTPFLPCGAAPAHPCITPGVASGTFTNGVANITLPMTVFRGAAASGPFSLLDIGIAPVDSDGIVMDGYDLDTLNVTAGASNHRKVVRADLRYGRLKLSSAHGSELLPLPIPATAQYWNGSTYVTNADDGAVGFGSTSIPSANIVFSNWQKALNSGNVWVTTPASVVFVNGRGTFTLRAPGQGVTGSVDMSVASPAYLPTTTPARARYGVFKGNTEFIYMRENY
ncbi:MAG TPA: DUF6701 domain-containing protein [Paucimonas sp.]|nr:DUF6701 domain-containing protein [Paucimonas sp.]